VCSFTFAIQFFSSYLERKKGVYVSYYSELEISSCGDSPEEALHNLKEAVKLYLENAKKLGMLKDIEKAAQIPEKFISFLKIESLNCSSPPF